MTIRPSTEQDIPAIVELLKLSLGESLMPKSEAFWRWKHVDNPFGKSPVLVAEENGQLIGVRAFMRWQWTYQNRIYKAVRAVDTATHPQHQGKGIFKNLTLQLVDQCKADGVDFIFNTPNTSSKPGYLKMGWMSNGKMKLAASPRLNFKKQSSDFDSIYAMNQSSFSAFKFSEADSNYMRTNLTEKFLLWRYTSNPNIEYYTFSDPTNRYSIIFRLKKYRLGIEFRICNCMYEPEAFTELKQHLKVVIMASGANLVTTAEGMELFPSLTLAIGPEITTRPLSFDGNFLSFSFWKPTLGDMEVF